MNLKLVTTALAANVISVCILSSTETAFIDDA